MHYLRAAMSTAHAALAAISALAMLATLPTTHAEDLDQFYLTVVHKGKPMAHLKETVGPLYIPANQCSGDLDSVLQCDDGSKLRAVRVRVHDGAFAYVTLENDFRRSNVLRSDCSAEAIVFLDFACDSR